MISAIFALSGGPPATELIISVESAEILRASVPATQFEGLLGDDLFQLQGLALEVFDLAGGCRSGRVVGQTPLAGFEELFRPAVVEAFGDPFPAAEFGDRDFAAASRRGRCGSSPRPNVAWGWLGGYLSRDARTASQAWWISVSCQLLRGCDDEPEFLRSCRSPDLSYPPAR